MWILRVARIPGAFTALLLVVLALAVARVPAQNAPAGAPVRNDVAGD